MIYFSCRDPIATLQSRKLYDLKIMIALGQCLTSYRTLKKINKCR